MPAGKERAGRHGLQAVTEDRAAIGGGGAIPIMEMLR
jgi:hypothetical protein